jgi:transposase, IS30 family
MKSIHQRPPGARSRREIGQWEGDLILGSGQRSAIATLVERKTRIVKLVHLPRGYSAPALADALIETFRGLPGGFAAL